MLLRKAATGIAVVSIAGALAACQYEAPIIAGISESISGLSKTTIATTWTSL